LTSVIISNSLGQLDNGRKPILFPSRWTAAVTSESRPFSFYPYELAYLASLLKRDLPDNTFRVKMIDPNIMGLTKEETIRYLRSYRPDYLVFEPSAVDCQEIFDILAYFKQRCLTVGIVVGAYAKAEPQICQNHADFVVPGEYETAVLQLIAARVRPGDKHSVAGVYPNARRDIIDPDALPWPEDQDICRLDYTEPGCDGRMIQVYASRGCALACSFCVVPTYYGDKGKTWRPRDPVDVAEEIGYLNEKYNGLFQGIFFNEEAHNTSRDWLEALCQALIAQKLNHLKYDAMCVYFNFDDAILQLMRRAGYHQIRFGIESFATEVGKKIRKNVKYHKLKELLEKTRQYGFVTYGTSMVGAQGSTFESDLDTHNLLCHLRDELSLLDKWQVSIATPQPGTPFYQWAKSTGHLITEDLSHYNGRQAVVAYPGYSASEITAMFQIFQSKQPHTLATARATMPAAIQVVDDHPVPPLVPVRELTC
jgi:radical SAM superfamily enzyme YgiQ (UPF0313 family)